MFYSPDLDQLYNIVYSEDEDVMANHLNFIQTQKSKILKLKENIVKVGKEPIIAAEKVLK